MAAFSEKDFYLDEFRGRTLLIAAGWSSLRNALARRRLRSVVADLTAHDSRVLVVVGDRPVRAGSAAAVRRWLGLPVLRVRRGASRARGRARYADTVEWRPDDPETALGDIWQVLRVRSLGIVLSFEPAAAVGCRIAERLRVHKLVLIDPAGGLLERGGRHPLSFLDQATLDVLLAAGEAEFQGMSQRRQLLAEIDRVLAAGVRSVNLCRASALARELFTYEGAGTLFTHGAYCRVERLAVDDFHEVERLVQRGQAEGLLKPRDPEEIGELLLGGFGAWVGGDHLAGIGALRIGAYAEYGAGEIIGLYTITRFKGEGIGYRLVRRLIEEARARGTRFLFAVTTADRAAEFFRREGFREVGPDDVPPLKWRDYDPSRRARAMAFRRELG